MKIGKIGGIMLLIALLGFTNFTMKDNYGDLWKKVIELENERKPKSALAVVEKIYTKASKEKEIIQLTKSIIYKGKFIMQTEEESYEKVVLLFKEEIAKSPSPTKEILQSVEGTLYLQYLNQNRWQIQQRSRIEDFEENNPVTWPTNTFIDKIATSFKASIQNPKALSEPLNKYDELLDIYDDESLKYLPTLYDLLATRAFDFFANNQTYLTAPVYQYSVNEERYFAPIDEFISMTFTSKDSTSLLLEAIHLIQDHLTYNNDRPEAKAFINLKRLDLIYNQSRLAEKERLYEHRLLALEEDCKDLQLHPEIYARLAQLYNNRATRNHKEHTDDYITALAYCKKAIDLYPKHPASNTCINIYNGITALSLNAVSEQAYPSNQEILIKLDYRNIDKVFLKLFSISEKEKEEMEKNRNNDDIIKFLNKKTALQNWSQKLFNDDKYYNLNGEIHIPSLPVGFYGLVINDKEKINKKDNVSRLLYIYVTDLSYQVFQGGTTDVITVMDRSTGAPITGASVDLYTNRYNRDKRKNEKINLGNYSTDKDGHVVVKEIKNRNNSRNYSLKIRKGNDFFETRENHYLSRRGESSGHERTIFYTDRGIYRPGQTVFFKVLRLSIDKKGVPSIIKNEELEIDFYDANRQTVSDLILQTNEYGTASGSFVTPTGSLNGIMEISHYDGSTNFRVEEYKRPKFEVTSLPLEELYQLNDSVTVKAKAVSYAGAVVDNAQVVYRVSRGVSFPWWYWGCGYRYPYYSNNAVEISNGQTTTDKNGNIEIIFEAAPAQEVLLKWNPMYAYTVYMDVTDSNGETHSLVQTVRIGKQSRLLNFTSVPSPFLTDVKDQKLKLNITDLNGAKKRGKGTITFYSLVEPDHVKNKRYWPHPDSIHLPKNTFDKNHPFYSWTEDDFKTWDTKDKIDQIDFDHDGEGAYAIPKLDGGVYKVVASMQDANDEEIIKETYINALNFRKATFPKTKHLYYSLDKTAPESYVPGNKVELYLGSPSENLKVLFRVEKDHKVISQKWINLKGKERIKIPVTESDRGGFVILLSYIKNNRPFQEKINISVPWNNKKLNVEFISFRDKTLPGSEEEYKIKISGPDKDKVSAELLACMYDASLDDFISHQWNGHFYPSYNSSYYSTFPGFNQQGSRYVSNDGVYKNRLKFKGKHIMFPRLHDFGFGFQYGYGDVRYRGSRSNATDIYVDGVRIKEESMSMDEVTITAYKAPMIQQDNTTQGKTVTAEQVRSLPTKNISDLASTTSGISVEDFDEEAAEINDAPKPQIRTNLNETVFFYPQLETDKDGNVLISFKMNEALTKWKLMTFAHTEDLKTGMEIREVVTQKDLMVVPNPPRFLRDNDEIVFTSKINNLTDKSINGTVRLELLNAITLKPLEGILSSANVKQDFIIEAKQSTLAKWTLNIPEREVDAITYRVIAVSGSHSDGEENVLPVLTNKILVTETMPLTVDPLETKSFTFTELVNADATVSHQNYSLEYTANPAWYAVQAMPFIKDQSYRNAPPSIFNQLYTNVLASHIVNKHPKLKAVFDEWKNTDSDALISNLEKNQELKSAILKETPWVRQAMSETEQKKNIALLFDLNLISYQRSSNITALQQLQHPDGGFSWDGHNKSNRYISQNILEGLGHLSRLGINIKDDHSLKPIIDNLIRYCDEQIKREYDKRDKKHKYLSHIAVHYLYTRSFFKETKITMQADDAFKYYLALAEAKVLDYGIYKSGMIGLLLNRYDKKDAARKVTESLLERSLTHEELGMYWNEGNGFNWYELPIERHAMMIELMVEMGKKEVVDNLKLWLLRNKQTNHWKTTKATAAAIYALLVEEEEGGMSKWVLDAKIPTIKVAGNMMDFSDNTQAGTGYVKRSWDKSEIDMALANVEITNPNDHIGWGGIYWQYFEDMDKVKTFEKTPLKVRKSLYKKVLDDRGEKIIPVSNDNLKIGDKLIVRIELESDRSMEYLHLKDMRASGLEPMSTLSGYKWSHGLGYYQSSRDLATDFFISYLPKGKYVFEYNLRVQHAGTFSNGITTIQSMYAPEFTSHSQGDVITVLEN